MTDGVTRNARTRARFSDKFGHENCVNLRNKPQILPLRR